MENAVVQSKCGKMPYGTASDQLPIRNGLNKPKTKNNHIAAKNAHATCFPFCAAEPKDSFLATTTLQKLIGKMSLLYTIHLH